MNAYNDGLEAGIRIAGVRASTARWSGGEDVAEAIEWLDGLLQAVGDEQWPIGGVRASAAVVEELRRRSETGPGDRYQGVTFACDEGATGTVIEVLPADIG